MIKPTDDIGFKLDMYWSKKFHKVHGRFPNRKELVDFERLAHAEAEAESLVIKQKEERERAEKERLLEMEDLARSNLVRSRLRNRNEIPKDYSPPDSVKQLLEMVQSGETYVAFTKIRGTADERILIDTDLEGLNLESSIFEFVDFSSSCNLNKVNFKNSTFQDVTFQSKCSAKEVDFYYSTFSSTKFSPEACIIDASFKNCSFENDSYIDFDKNLISDVVFLKNDRTDSWHKLSTPFSGIWQYINVTLSGAYLISLYFKIQMFNGISATSQHARHLIEYETTKKITLYEFVFGESYTSVIAALLILLYQMLRLYMTLKIGPMIESTKASGVTPEKIRFVDYIRIMPFMAVLGYSALVVFLWNFWLLLNSKPLVY